MKYNKQNLINSINNGLTFKYLCFWGHQPSLDGSITKTCFSQWWLATFVVDGIEYKSAEHWMMAEKARLFNDTETLAKIIACNTPAEAKKLGREVQNFEVETWKEKCFEIVVQGNIHKFSQNDDLKEFLLNTHERVIVEASPRDPIWGIGLGINNPNAENPEGWRGTNLLGFALMEVRDKLKSNNWDENILPQDVS
jgi:ribA/ribD-fused uncharacterized protein